MAKIKKITKEQYKGKVYDLTVDKSHSYNIDGLAVHNSGVGSLVLYCLGVIGIDPIKYGLSMDRFLYAEADYHITESDFFDVDTKENINGNKDISQPVNIENLDIEDLIEDLIGDEEEEYDFDTEGYKY